MADHKEQYTMGYGPASTAMMSHRTAQAHAGFILPHLKPGMKLLDCGCGPGSLTLSFAEFLAPGEVVGTDLVESQLEVGRSEAEKRNITNARFEIASIYELPFPDDTFDAVFVSAVLGNLQEPIRGIIEARRVLKPGGVIGIKEFDHGGDLFYPNEQDHMNSIALYHRLRRHNGHSPENGRKILAFLQEAGFHNVTSTATYNTYSGAEVLKQVGGLFSELVDEAFAEPFVRLGWATPEEVSRMAQVWQEFPQMPGAFYAQAWCEGLGWK